jgi:AraC family transcriptional regulator, transcriptional activator FtrA
MPAPVRPHLVAALAYDGLCTFEFGIVVEVFALPRPEFDFAWYDFQIAGADTTIRAMGGFRIEVDAGLGLLDKADTIIIPGWRDRDERPPERILATIRAAHERGARLVTICSGAFVLAAAGLLDGRRVTTHWRHAPALKAAYPQIELVDDVLYVEDSGIITSAGSSAGIDACLHLIRSDYGAKVANIVARRLVMPPHRDGGQAQYIDAPIQARPGKSIATVLDWVRERLAGPVGIGEMARHAGLSERTFLRRFREGTGITPLKWLRRERISLAMKLLEEPKMSLDNVSSNCGFESPESFRKAFHEIAGVSPSSYRRRFREAA